MGKEKVHDNYRLTFNEQIRFTPEEELILYWRERPVEAQKDIIGYNLNWFQRMMLKAAWSHSFNLWVMGRGCSKTFLIAITTVLYAMLYPGWNIGLIAPVFRQANFIFDEITKIVNKSKYVSSCVTKFSRAMDRSIIQFSNGSSIEALPLGADGAKIRGRRYRFVAIDEAAQCPIEVIESVVMPFLSIQIGGFKNKVIWASSAYYKHNHFYSKYIRYRINQISNPNKYSVLEFNYHDILADPNQDYQVDMDIVRESQESMSEEEFAMEYLAKFPDESMGFFSARIIDACIRKLRPISIEPAVGDLGARYLLAIDCARKLDNFVITIFKLVGNEKHIVRIITHNRIPYDQMVDIIRKVCVDYNVVRIIMDQGGGGLSVKDYLAKSWIDTRGDIAISRPGILDIEDPEHKYFDGNRILHMYAANNPRNERLFNRAKAEMQAGRVVFPLDIRNHENPLIKLAAKEFLLLKTEMGVVEVKVLQHGVTFSVPRKYHDDRLITFVMGVTESCDYLAGEDLTMQRVMPTGVFVRR